MRADTVADSKCCTGPVLSVSIPCVQISDLKILEAPRVTSLGYTTLAFSREQTEGSQLPNNGYKKYSQLVGNIFFDKTIA